MATRALIRGKESKETLRVKVVTIFAALLVGCQVWQQTVTDIEGELKRRLPPSSHKTKKPYFYKKNTKMQQKPHKIKLVFILKYLQTKITPKN